MLPERGPLTRRALLAALVGGGGALAVRALPGAQAVVGAEPPVRLNITSHATADTVVSNSSTSSSARGLHGRARGHGVAGTHSVSGNTGSLGRLSDGVFGQAYSASGNGVRGVANNGSVAYGVWGSSADGYGVVGHGVTGVAGASPEVGGAGVTGTADEGTTAAGVYGASAQGTGVAGNGLTGVAGRGTVGMEGVDASGINYGRVGTSTVGLLGQAGTSDGTGVIGTANTGALAFGVWGRSTSGYAGYFSGDVVVTGDLASTAAGFLVDHPDDPEGRLLGQAFVASHERLSVYSGNVITDGTGRATVRLPGYVGSLNADFRYQLTVLGSFAQAVVSRRVQDGSFQVRTSEPRVEVSWQVTGVRDDPYARRHPFRAERRKAGALRGRLLRPDLHGRDRATDLTAAHRDGLGSRPRSNARPTLDRKARTALGRPDR